MLQHVMRERKILRATSRYPEMFVRVHCAFQTRRHLFLVQDFVQGGDCLTLITQMGTVPERTTKLIMAEVIHAVKFLHSHGIVHRDIKPDNVLITSQGHPRLVDFGMASSAASARRGHVDSGNGTDEPNSNNSTRNGLRDNGSSNPSSWLQSGDGTYNQDSRENTGSGTAGMLQGGSGSTISFTGRNVPDNLMHTPVGNYNYAPPEALISAGYDHTIDWWCVGIMFFHFLAGRTPFEADTKEATQDNIG